MKKKSCIFWFRRDLRLQDNNGLTQALKSDYTVVPIFIFDSEILSKLENPYDLRVTFIHNQLEIINKELAKYGSRLHVFIGKPIEIFKTLITKSESNIKAVFTNKDYDPYALKRDYDIKSLLLTKSISFNTFKDQVIFEENEILKQDKTPYIVYTPYKNKWKEKLPKSIIEPFRPENTFANLQKTSYQQIPTLPSLGFKICNTPIPSLSINKDIVLNYHQHRNLPSINGTNKWSHHLRFGTVSIRFLCKIALKHNETLLNELIWREFYQMILFHFPKSATQSFKPAYDFIEWDNNEENFYKWSKGQTGYPMVDAGMRELNQTGLMHNRLRMITASFLTKHLLIDWRWGERYFAKHLLDFDLAANVGGWQWSAGSGCDAAPYFRIFNPTTQQKKFDPDNNYINKWIPELSTNIYPNPIVNHSSARLKALAAYKAALR